MHATASQAGILVEYEEEISPPIQGPNTMATPKANISRPYCWANWLALIEVLYKQQEGDEGRGVLRAGKELHHHTNNEKSEVQNPFREGGKGGEGGYLTSPHPLHNDE